MCVRWQVCEIDSQQHTERDSVYLGETTIRDQQMTEIKTERERGRESTSDCERDRENARESTHTRERASARDQHSPAMPTWRVQ